jgi:hypothetical protein
MIIESCFISKHLFDMFSLSLPSLANVVLLAKRNGKRRIAYTFPHLPRPILPPT